MITLFCEHVEDWIWGFAFDTCFSDWVVKRGINWTIGDVVKNECSLGVLLFEIFHGLRTKDPVFGFEVGLENCRSEVLFAFGIEDIFHVLEEDKLLLNVIIDILYLGLSLVEFFVDLLELG